MALQACFSMGLVQQACERVFFAVLILCIVTDRAQDALGLAVLANGAGSRVRSCIYASLLVITAAGWPKCAREPSSRLTDFPEDGDKVSGFFRLRCLRRVEYCTLIV